VCETADYNCWFVPTEMDLSSYQPLTILNTCLKVGQCIVFQMADKNF